MIMLEINGLFYKEKTNTKVESNYYKHIYYSIISALSLWFNSLSI
jgi:hypothetical protein